MYNILVLGAQNTMRSQIAEAYFNFYARGKGLFFSAGIEAGIIHDYTIQVMLEDNIDLIGQQAKSLHVFAETPFDYLITLCEIEDQDLIAPLSFQKWYHLPVKAPCFSADTSEIDCIDAFRQTRDDLKRLVLRFIGQELSQSNESQFASW